MNRYRAIPVVLAALLVGVAGVAIASSRSSKSMPAISGCEPQPASVRASVRCYLQYLNRGDVDRVRDAWVATNERVTNDPATGQRNKVLSEKRFAGVLEKRQSDADSLVRSLKGRLDLDAKLKSDPAFKFGPDQKQFLFPTSLAGFALRIQAQKVAPDGVSIVAEPIGEKQPPYRWNIRGRLEKELASALLRH